MKYYTKKACPTVPLPPTMGSGWGGHCQRNAGMPPALPAQEGITRSDRHHCVCTLQRVPCVTTVALRPCSVNRAHDAALVMEIANPASPSAVSHRPHNTQNTLHSHITSQRYRPAPYTRCIAAPHHLLVGTHVGVYGVCSGAVGLLGGGVIVMRLLTTQPRNLAPAYDHVLDSST